MLPFHSKMSGSTIGRRAAYLIACLAPAWAAITFINDGVVWRLGPIRVSSTEPLRPMAVGLAAAAWYVYRSSRTAMDADGAWLGLWLHRLATVAIPLIIILGCVVGFVYGTFAASGSDAYGYVSQADLWLRGKVSIEQPIVQQVSWPNAAWTFTPLGYRPVSDLGTIAPTYPPGLPLLMAAFKTAFGPQGVFFVVPLLAAVALGATYALGVAATRSRSVGALAALLLLASPVFLWHSMVPMTDVPVTAGWALACMLALRQPAPRPLLSGLAAGASILIRPNLILLAAAPVLSWFLAERDSRDGWRPALRKVGMFAAGMLPAVLLIGVLNHLMYGSALESGYGSLSDNYNVGATVQNIRNYSGWLVQTQTVFVALAFVPFFVSGSLRPSTRDSSPKAGLASLLALVALSYAFYHPFGNWTYLRFLLPAYPAMFVLMAAGVRGLSLKLPLALRAPSAILFAVIVVSASLQFAKDNRIFLLWEQEQRYIRAAVRVTELTPAGAMLFASQHSGSLRYHANRMTLRYDQLPPEHLDSAIRELRDNGKPSYVVIDEWERADFQSRFAGSRSGGLREQPLARVAGPPDVLIFELRDPIE